MWIFASFLSDRYEFCFVVIRLKHDVGGGEDGDGNYDDVWR